MGKLIYDESRRCFIDDEDGRQVLYESDPRETELIRTAMAEHPNWNFEVSGDCTLIIHDPNYRNDDSLIFSITTSGTNSYEMGRRLDSYTTGFPTEQYDRLYQQFDMDIGEYPDNFDSMTRTEQYEYMQRTYNMEMGDDIVPDLNDVDYTSELQNVLLEETGISDPAIKVLFDDEGHAQIYSNGTLISTSPEPVTNKSEFMAFVNRSNFSSNNTTLNQVEAHSTGHNDVLFSGENFDNIVSYVDAEGNEHKFTLSASDMDYYLGLKDEDKVKFLMAQTMSHYGVSNTSQVLSYPLYYEDANGDQQVIYLSQAEYDEYIFSFYDDTSFREYMSQKYGLPQDTSYSGVYGENKTGITINYNTDLENGLQVTYTDQQCYDFINRMTDEDLVGYLDDKYFVPVKIEKKINEARREVEITYYDANGQKRKKVFKLDDPDDYITTRMVQNENSYVISDVNQGGHVLTFDDGRTITLTDEQYREYLRRGTNYLSSVDENGRALFPAYNESLITHILDGSFQSSFDVRRIEENGVEYYVIISNGQIIKKVLLADIQNADGSIDQEKLVNVIQAENDNDKLNKKVYDKNSRFEFSKYLISFDDEMEYKSIVEKLKSSRDIIDTNSQSLNSTTENLSAIDDSYAGTIKTVVDGLNEAIDDTEYLESAVDKTVDIYRSCDADLKSVFESGIIDEIFSKAGLFVYDKDSASHRKRSSEYRKPENRVDIRVKEKYLGILHDAATTFDINLKEMSDNWKRWNDPTQGFEITEEQYNKIAAKYGNFAGSYADFVKNYGGCIGSNVIGYLINGKYGEQHLTEDKYSQFEEDFYGMLSSGDPNNPSDYDKYIGTAATIMTPEGVLGVTNLKRFVQSEKYFSYALSDEYESNLKSIRENADNYTDDQWWELAMSCNISVDEAKNALPYQLAMLQTLNSADNRSIEAIKDSYGQIDYNREDEITYLNDEYQETILKDSMLKRKARENGMRELMNYRNGIDLGDLCTQFAASLFENTVGGIANLFDPSYTSLLSEQAYKHQYMLDLIAESRQPENAALRYSRGEISKNQYDLLMNLSVIGISDEAGNRITNANAFMETAGKITGSLIMGKIGATYKGLKPALNIIKALNKGGKTASSLYNSGMNENDARWIGLINAAAIFGANYTTKKLFSMIWPDLPDQDEIKHIDPPPANYDAAEAAAHGGQATALDNLYFADRVSNYVYNHYGPIAAFDTIFATELRNAGGKTVDLTNQSTAIAIALFGAHGNYAGGQSLEIFDSNSSYDNVNGVDTGALARKYWNKNPEKAREEIEKWDLSNGDQGFGLELLNDLFGENAFMNWHPFKRD